MSIVRKIFILLEMATFFSVFLQDGREYFVPFRFFFFFLFHFKALSKEIDFRRIQNPFDFTSSFGKTFCLLHWIWLSNEWKRKNEKKEKKEKRRGGGELTQRKKKTIKNEKQNKKGRKNKTTKEGNPKSMFIAKSYVTEHSHSNSISFVEVSNVDFSLFSFFFYFVF